MTFSLVISTMVLCTGLPVEPQAIAVLVFVTLPSIHETSKDAAIGKVNKVLSAKTMVFRRRCLQLRLYRLYKVAAIV